MDDTMADLCAIFVAECMDYIDELEPQFIELARVLAAADDGAAMQLMNHIFRLVHTIKGSAGSLGYQTIAGLAHRAENLLDLVRHKRLTLTPERLELLTKCLDIFRALMTHLHAHQTDEGTGHLTGEMCEQLDRTILDGGAPHASRPAPPAAAAAFGFFSTDDEPAPPPPQAKVTEAMRTAFFQESEESLGKIELCLVSYQDLTQADRNLHLAEALRLLHSFKGNCGFIQYTDMEALVHGMETALEDAKGGALADEKMDELLKCVDVLKSCLSAAHLQGTPAVPQLSALLAGLASGDAAAPAPAGGDLRRPAASVTPGTVGPAAAAAPAGAMQRSDVRVDLRKLDALINLVGELVMAEAMVTGRASERLGEDDQLERAVHHLRRTTMSLQDIAMSVRMVPVSQTFKKMIRLVHETSAKLGKKVRLNLVGEETEIDKTVIEQIGDPLVHCVRNSIDHGLESPEERRRAGKDEVGTITLEARHEGGEVWITVDDDGKGLSRDRILARARERGLVPSDRDGALSDAEIYNFIFEPGFSTAEKVTDVSGRGVGMDVVKKNIEKVKGSIRVESQAGQGARVTFRIPLTLAVIDGMMIRVGQAKYTLPLLAIQESIRVEPDRLITGPDGSKMLNLRSRFIPIIRLDELMQATAEPARRGDMIVVVVEVQNRSFAMLVDEILGQQQTVIKALPTIYRHSRHVSGCSILPNGEVSLIIDIGGIASRLNKQYDSFVASDAQ